MQDKNYTGIIPSQKSGLSIKAKTSIVLDTEEASKSFFQTVKHRLMHVNNWHNIAGGLSANFQLTDENGYIVEGEVKKGFYFRIDIPGPGTKTGGGYDWVRVEEIESISEPKVESISIRVRPAQNPSSYNKENVSHFYSKEATSSFVVARERKKITAAIYDRNIKPNTKVEKVADKIRDIVVGTAGIIAFSKLQWKSLTEGLLNHDTNK
jgi:hypothetical protein